MTGFNITVNADDHIAKTRMLSAAQNIRISNDKVYMWYTSQKLIETRGGFDGKLIHGPYRSFYLNNQLMEQGEICYGLRHGEWKYWYADGRLKEVISWKKGLKHGGYTVYNEQGYVMARGHFKRDKLHGSFCTYSSTGKMLEKKKYRNGAEVIPRIKPAKQKVPREKKQKLKEPKELKEPKGKDQKPKGQPLFTRLFKKKGKTAPSQEQVPDKRRIVHS